MRLLTSAIYIVAICCSLLVERPIQADEIEEQMTQLAKMLKGDLGTDRPIRMGRITTTMPNSTGGPRIQAQLKSSLEDAGFQFSSSGKLTIGGRYSIQKDSQDDPIYLALEVTVMNVFTEELSLVVRLKEETTLATMLGVNVVPPPVDESKSELTPAEEKSRIEAIENAVLGDAPTAELAEVKIEDPQTGQQSLPVAEVLAPGAEYYAIQILSRSPEESDFQVREVTLDDESGSPFVQLNEGDIYKIKVINRSNYATGATITIDGLSSFHFSDVQSFRETDKWVIKRDDVGVIPGWHLSANGNNHRYADFQIGKFGEVADSQFGTEADVGTITVLFFPAWNPEEEPPPTNIGFARGTITGAERTTTLKTVSPNYGRLRASISIRYEK